jgi:2-C-methyl-D-erythritol 4-phosphate cytidylyltransferase
MCEDERPIVTPKETISKIDDFAVIIVAAGNGLRLGGDTPKTFIDLAGTPMCFRPVDIFSEMGFKNIILVVPKKWIERAEEIAKDRNYASPIKIINGGEKRVYSAKKGLEALIESFKDNPDNIPGKVLIHDGDRVFPRKEKIKAVCEALDNFSAVVPGIPVSDTVRKREGNLSMGIENRKNLVLVQTPQGFHTLELMEIINSTPPDTLDNITDEATLVELKGLSVGIVDGDPLDFKITNKMDLVMAEIVAGSEIIFTALKV